MAEAQRRLEFATYRKSDLPLVVLLSGGPGGGDHRAHCHDFYELVYVHRGEGLHVIQDHPYPMLQGDFYLMRPDDAHSYRHHDELGIFNILFLPELFPADDWQALLQLPGLGAYLRCDGGSAPHKLALVPEHQRAVERLCHRMREELEACEPGWRFAARSSFTQLLVLLSRASATYGEQPRHEDLPPGPMAEAIATIHRHADQALSVADLAADAGWTSNYFGERFKQATGLTVQRYIGKLRVDRARILLEDPERSITAIALDVGFDDPSYFGRVFKQHTGLTPRAYRRLGTLRSRA
jgi:AraC-like DNA-binding protein/quercetin dioxygenase-like cupin family protein